MAASSPVPIPDPPAMVLLRSLLFVPLFFASVSIGAVPPSSLADTSQRTQSATSTLGEDLNLSHRRLDEENAFAPASEGDDDLGQQLILKETPKQQAFRFNADAGLFWTDNARHAKTDAEQDTFWNWRVEAEWQPRITNKLYGEVGLSQDWFRYDKMEDLDFEALTATAGFYYVMPELADSVLLLQYEYQRFTHEGDSLFNSHSIRFGVQKVVLLDRRNSLNLSLLADWDIDTDEALVDRNEYSADVSWRYKLMPNLVFGLGYRYTCLDYNEGGRTDSLHALAFSVSYSPKPWFEIYAGYTYTFNRSNFS
ncbi:MAG: hypothetical protein JWO08_2499, partial [Verrucomicrobiaceae bacterium]|nr:hypothetical protein [Verrucomicrobiaceae bacterium]